MRSDNLGSCRRFCQWRGVFFTLLAVVSLLLGGCGPRNMVPPDRFRTELLRDTFEALATAPPARTIRQLERLADAWPDQAFVALALAHEEERQAVTNVNEHLASGDLAAAAVITRSVGRQGRIFQTLRPVERLPEALATLRQAGAGVPYADSATAIKALDKVLVHRELLEQSPVFVGWLAEQNAHIEALRQREIAAALRELTAAYDRLSARGDPQADQLPAQAAALNAEHPLPRLVEAAQDERWNDLSQWFAATAPAPDDHPAVAEMVLNRYWESLPGTLRQSAELSGFVAVPRTLSGSILAIRSAAARGHTAEALAGLRTIAAVVPLDTSTVGSLLETAVLPRHQFTAGCWRAPFPAVTDVLNRLAQLREHSNR